MSSGYTEQWLRDYQARRGLRIEIVDCPTPQGRIDREVSHDYKAEFEQQLSLVGIQVEREYFFHPSRKWRSDWIVKGTKVLVEFEGGLFTKNKIGHGSVSGILRDISKYNEATLLGYLVLRITPKQVTSGEALQWVERAIVLDQLGLTSETSLDKTPQP